MKKFVAVAVVLVMFGITKCGGSDDGGVNQTDAVDEVVETVPTPTPIPTPAPAPPTTREEWNDSVLWLVGDDRAEECADDYKSTEDAQTCRDLMESICERADDPQEERDEFARDNGDGTYTVTLTYETTVLCKDTTLLAWGTEDDENRWLLGAYYGTKRFAGLFRENGPGSDRGGYSRSTTERPAPPRKPSPAVPRAPAYTPPPVYTPPPGSSGSSNGSSGGSGTYTGPRCYAPGGKTWTPC